MARATTFSDAFNAVAEPRRREIIDLLAERSGWAVNDLVLKMGIPQPAVSKHLSILRKVGLVSVMKQGKNRFYNLEGRGLKPLHDWVSQFERFWDDHLIKIKELSERKARESLSKKEKP
jgi:DNA-binding transcriptional ArsR family regulator